MYWWIFFPVYFHNNADLNGTTFLGSAKMSNWFGCVKFRPMGIWKFPNFAAFAGQFYWTYSMGTLGTGSNGGATIVNVISSWKTSTILIHINWHRPQTTLCHSHNAAYGINIFATKNCAPSYGRMWCAHFPAWISIGNRSSRIWWRPSSSVMLVNIQRCVIVKECTKFWRPFSLLCIVTIKRCCTSRTLPAMFRLTVAYAKYWIQNSWKRTLSNMRIFFVVNCFLK